jgi:uncharacterized protein (TIGR02466 family)
MSYDIENLFPTPIYSCVIENQHAVQLEIANALLNVKYDDAYHYNNWGNTFETTDPTVDIIVEKQLTNLDQAIHQHLEQYCTELRFDMRKYRRTSWIVKNSTGGHTMCHTHSEYDIAGVYYYQTNEADGEIYFESPVSSAVSSLCYQRYAEKYQHKPVAGKLLLFPGWLAHGVKTNTTDTDRISVAFSIGFVR